MESGISQQSRHDEVDAKLAQVRALLAAQSLDALLLEQTYNVAWLTGGAETAVNIAADRGPVSLIVTPDHAYAVSDRVEEPRLRDEEGLADVGFEIVVEPWYRRGAFIAEMRERLRLSDDDSGASTVSQEIQRLRTTLHPNDATRLRVACRLAADAIGEVMAAVTPGMTEFAVAAQLDQASRARGGIAVVNLIGSDERIAAYRHPLPTAKPIERYVMVVLCLRVRGLVAATTRLVHFGALPADLERRARAVATIDAQMIQGTQAGRSLSDQWQLAADAYGEAGYPGAIEEHHQGGSIGYLTRERLATPDDTTHIQPSQAFAWNPSVRGVKSEDTILLTDHGPEVLTAMDGWPLWDITLDGQIIQRPAILIRDPNP